MIKKTSSWFFIVALTLLVIISGLLITIRIALPKINLYSVEISEFLSKKLQADVEIGSIKALWVQAKPQFIIEKISFTDQTQKTKRINISKLQAELDVIASIKNFAPIFVHLEIDDLSINAEQKNSRWLTVFSPPLVSEDVKKPTKSSNDVALNRLLTVLSMQSKVKFNNAELVLKPENKPIRTIGPIQFLMQNTTKMHQLSGEAKLKHYGENSVASFAIQARELSDLIIKTPYKVYAKFENVSEQLLALNLINLGVNVKKLSLNSRVWATLENGFLKDVSGKVLVNSLAFEEKNYPKLLDTTFDFSFKDELNKHSLQLSNVNLNTGTSHVNIPQAVAVYNQVAGGFLEKIAISKINLGDVSTQLIKQSYIADQIKNLITELNLKGVVNNLRLTWQSNKLKDFSLKADLDKVSADSYIGAPQLSGVSGLLNMTAFKGEIDLNAEDLSMHFPKLFTNAWQYSQATGKVSWKVEVEEDKPARILVNSQLLSFSKQDTQARGRFSLLIPVDKTLQTELILMIGMQNSAAKDVLNYIPSDIVGSSLSQWIASAALGGQVDEAGFVLRTGFRKDIPLSSKPSVQMYLNLSDAKINFDKKWPNYNADNAHIIIEDGDVHVSAINGTIAGNQTSNLSVVKQHDEGVIKVNTLLFGDLQKLFSKLKQKPAMTYFPEVMRNWKITGTHQSSLNLQIPVTGKKAPLIDVTSKVKDASLLDDQYELSFTSINGALNFNSEKGLNSKSLNLSTFGYPGKMSIKSTGIKSKQKISISLNSGIKIKDLAQKFATDSLQEISGSTKFDVRLDICPNKPSCNQLVLNSDLKGIAINMPAPWGKSKKQSRKLQVVSNTGASKAVVWRYNYANMIRGITQLPTQKTNNILATSFTNIVFGGEKPKLPKSSGIYLGGALNGINLDRVLSFFDSKDKAAGSKGKASNADTISAIKKVELKLHNVTLLKNKINNSWVSFTRNSQHWSGKFNTQIASGKVLIPHNRNNIANVQLDKLVINSAKDQGSIKAKHKSPSAKLDSNQWPKVNLSITKLILNSLNIGKWSANLAPTKKGYKISNINGGIATTKIYGEVAWANEQNDIKTYFDLKAKGGDFGVVLKQLGYAKVLENKTGIIESQLSWQGYPWDFQQGNLNGRVKFNLQKGRVIEAGTSANFLRIFGLLNLNSVIKRLQLDFSDLVESGVAFDTVSGKYYLQKGLATSQEPLKLQGDSATVEMSGTIDFANQSLDQKMLVVIPLSGNAPIAALLLATPQVAGIAFVVDKLFGKKLAKLTALRYAVTGSWLEPTIAPVKSARKKTKPSIKEK